MGGARRRSAGEQLELAIAAAADASSLADLGERALPHLQQMVGASATLLYRYDDAGRIEPLAGELRETIDEYARYYFHVDPVHSYPRQLGPEPRVVLATRHVDPRAYRRSPAYGEFYAAFELEHLACAWLTHKPYGAPGMTGLLFARPPTREEFGAEEVRLLGRALPALTAATARAERLRDLDVTRQALEAILDAAAGPARAVLASSGRLVWASRACERLLGAAPLSLAALRRAAHRLLAAPERPADARLSLDTVDGPREVYLSVLRTPSEPPLVLAEIAGAQAGARTGAELARRFSLTGAEGAVLAQLAEGLGNAAIAARLHVSIETVRTHVRRILGKLGVRSRVEAALLVARRL
jgi:DNA-binding CsgD family transcriptional regulator